LAKAFDLGLVGGGHFHPDLGGADMGQHFLHHGIRGRRRGQAGDDNIAILHQPGRAFARACAFSGQARHKIGVEIIDRQVHPVAQQAARQFAANVSQSDESNFHGLALLMPCHWGGVFRIAMQKQNDSNRPKGHG